MAKLPHVASVLRTAGALYTSYLAVEAMGATHFAKGGQAKRRDRWGALLTNACLITFFNPFVALLYVESLPKFQGAANGVGCLYLCGAHFLIALSVYAAVVAAAFGLARLLTRRAPLALHGLIVACALAVVALQVGFDPISRPTADAAEQSSVAAAPATDTSQNKGDETPPVRWPALSPVSTVGTPPTLATTAARPDVIAAWERRSAFDQSLVLATNWRAPKFRLALRPLAARIQPIVGPRARPKVHSMAPPERTSPETCRPNCRSMDGDQGTSWKPSPSSSMAKRPEARVSLWR